jgi:hypothetical protein
VVDKPSPNHLSAASDGRRHISQTVSSQSAALKSTAARSAPSISGKTKTLPGCLNPQCKGQHCLKDCTFTTPELKDELYAGRALLRKQQGDQCTTRGDSTTNKYCTSITNSATQNQTAAKSLRSTPAQTQLEGRFPCSPKAGSKRERCVTQLSRTPSKLVPAAQRNTVLLVEARQSPLRSSSFLSTVLLVLVDSSLAISLKVSLYSNSSL